MNVEHVKRILGHFNQTQRIRLADMSGDTFWHKNKRFCTDGERLLPFPYEQIDLKQRDIFRSALELKKLGIINIHYISGENWFTLNQLPTQEPFLPFLEMEVI